MSGHGRRQLSPEHLSMFDQNHAAATSDLARLVSIHQAHIDEGCTVPVTTACATGELLRLVTADPGALAVILGVAVEKLAAR